MAEVFQELRRILKVGACVAFEVGEVKQGTVQLEEAVIPAALDAGLEPVVRPHQRPVVHEDRQTCGA